MHCYTAIVPLNPGISACVALGSPVCEALSPVGCMAGRWRCQRGCEEYVGSVTAMQDTGLRYRNPCTVLYYQYTNV